MMLRSSVLVASLVWWVSGCLEEEPPPVDSLSLAASTGWTATLIPSKTLQGATLAKGWALIAAHSPPASCASVFLRGEGVAVAYRYNDADGSWTDERYVDGSANSIPVLAGSSWLAIYTFYDNAYLEYGFHGCEPAPEYPWDGYRTPVQAGFVNCGQPNGRAWKEVVVGGVILHDPTTAESVVRQHVQKGYQLANDVWAQCCIRIEQASPAPASATYYGASATASLIGSDYLMEAMGGGMTAEMAKVAAVRQTAFRTLSSDEIMAFWASFYINNSSAFVEGFVLARGDTPSVVVGNWVDNVTLAHEVGHHLIGPGHHGHPENLMYEHVSGRKLTGRQCTIAYNSRFAH